MSDAFRRHPRTLKRVSSRRLLDDFFKIDEHVVQHEKFDGSMSGDQRVLVFERGDAAAALLYNPAERKVILVNQFRLPTLGKVNSTGWLIETAAGMVRKDETPDQCILREIDEETGYQVTRLTPVAQFFSSPGGSSELIHLFYAEVRSTDRASPGGGAVEDGEDIAIEEYPLNLFLQMLANREFTDPKVIIAGQWLRDRQNRTTVRATSVKTQEFRVAGTADRRIGFITGDIMGVTNVDVWVNPENTDMIMDRFFGRSMSATIRLHGARKVPGSDRVDQDTIGDALKAAMGRRTFVKPAFVIPTTAGELAASNGVRQIFHVAAVQGQMGEGVTTNIDTLQECVTNVLNEIESASRWPPGLTGRPFESVVFPMLGTGEGGFFVSEVADAMVERALAFFKSPKRRYLRQIFFLAYSAADESILADVMERRRAERQLLSPGDALEVQS